MPPRKRAASAAKPDPAETGAEPAIEDDTDENDDAKAPDADDEQPDPAPPEPDTAPDPEPEKSDIQTVDEPCADCFPQGWPAQAFGLGCEHGTWSRQATA
jgi:hypothetical protein